MSILLEDTTTGCIVTCDFKIPEEHRFVGVVTIDGIHELSFSHEFPLHKTVKSYSMHDSMSGCENSDVDMEENEIGNALNKGNCVANLAAIRDRHSILINSKFV